ncbi:hypothetical protein TVAGG3_0728290 [Trichomonas vaginalis G3]|uniref:hypothetical protein n=1 Tax=Trichomonas vaginalis (strain ATCC PRA-98 / G3) TaxID=412133 RepID=UPI0021E5B65A|nr:hypothetical protein TVAGG3_0728290 [Trichomonas vaginalis G3]KAI5511065.1 hypothetical protein TVAGG3_0728290 [Trichomonas vaginalis G3]
MTRPTTSSSMFLTPAATAEIRSTPDGRRKHKTFHSLQILDAQNNQDITQDHDMHLHLYFAFHLYQVVPYMDYY